MWKLLKIFLDIQCWVVCKSKNIVLVVSIACHLFIRAEQGTLDYQFCWISVRVIKCGALPTCPMISL